MVKIIPLVNFCSDENIQTIFGTKLEDFLNYRTDYNSISLAIQRGNAASIRGTFPDSAILSEIFVL
jgi:hypothetical protein